MVHFLLHNPLNNQNYYCATVRSKIVDPVDVINTTVSKIVVDSQSDIMYISKNPIPYPKASLNYSYYKALGLYALRPDALAVYRKNEKGMYETIEDIEMLRLVERGIKVRSIEVISDSPSVDTPKDAKRIEEMLKSRLNQENIGGQQSMIKPVSYTHLTLPTKRIV